MNDSAGTLEIRETAGMLERRLVLVEHLRKIEYQLAHVEQARVAVNLMRGRGHDLGNSVQIVKLSALELQRRIAELGRTDIDELITDMATAADHAGRVLADMVEATRPPERITGAIVSHTLHAAVETVRPAFLAAIELRIDLDDTVQTYCSKEELEAIIYASAIEATTSTQVSHITFSVRERVIQQKRWVELLRIDDREVHDGDYAHMFEAGSLLKVVAEAAKAAGGEASIAPGRSGLELAVELPVAR